MCCGNSQKEPTSIGNESLESNFRPHQKERVRVVLSIKVPPGIPGNYVVQKHLHVLREELEDLTEVCGIHSDSLGERNAKPRSKNNPLYTQTSAVSFTQDRVW
ncbi:hypothetical protein AMECASPLE_026842 [Ameca splendens]|uniref:Uncharacterized protein n=1 Tax=Ameca splendens TaxID=208324 RepID=A0ABV0ZEC3_9TELE